VTYAELVVMADDVQASPLGVLLSESPLAFPVIEGLHLISLSLSVGLLFLIDLRLIGLIWRGLPAREVLSQLRPYVIAGFVAVFVTGILLFWAEAPALVASPAFPFKLLFIALAGLNALYFELAVARDLPSHPHAGPLPAAARQAGIASLLLWTLVIIAGRLIPYVPAWS
jgi:hypothetical protein